jgi:hypothetical protein
VVRVPGYRSRGPGFDSRRNQIFWEVVGLERSPLSLVSTTEKLLGRKSSGSSLESREYGRRDPSRWPCGTHYPQKVALTSPRSGGRSVGIVRSLTQATKFSFIINSIIILIFITILLYITFLLRIWSFRYDDLIFPKVVTSISEVTAYSVFREYVKNLI